MRRVEVAIIGGGPAGLSAGVSLVRNLRTTAIIDSSRPRHSATLVAHGFLTRDGISPLELRKLGQQEFESYEHAEYHQGVVTEVLPLEVEQAQQHGFTDGVGFIVQSRGIRGHADQIILAQRVLVTAGLVEELPALPSIRIYYGTDLHSCVECDGFEKSDAPLALIGETTDMFKRALLVSRFSSDLVLFTNGADTISGNEEAYLAELGIPVERRPIEDLVGENATMTGVRLTDGSVIPRVGGFVRPRWHAPVEFLEQIPLRRDPWGLLIVNAWHESDQRGLYATGDIIPPGPRSLMVAAGGGAEAALRINLDLIRTTHEL